MSTLVLGIGNILMADDGVGPEVIGRLSRHYRFPQNVELLDGGTLGLDLLPRLEGVENLIIVDAIETGGVPGTLQRFAGDAVPAAMTTKLSPHQIGVQDLLAVAALQGYEPRNLVLWGVQPADLEMGMTLSAAVAAQVDELGARVLAELEGWGFCAIPR